MSNLAYHLRSTRVLVGLLAFGLYLPGFWWGAPHATAPDRVQSWGVDDGLPLQPLADVHNIVQPKPDRNLGYPLMHSFVVTAAYSPYLGWLWLTGGFHPSPIYPFGLADPAGTLHTLTLIGHLLSVLIGVGIVVAAYDAAKALWDNRTGVVAALVTMTIFPMFYYSRTGNPDALMLFFTAAGLSAFARILAYGFTTRRAAALGVAVGFAVATKEQAAASFLAIPIVLLAVQLRGGERLLSWSFWRAPVVCGVCAFLAFGAGSGLFADPQFYRAHLEFGSTRIQAPDQGEVAFVQNYPRTWAGHAALAQLLAGYIADSLTLPGALLGLAGVFWTLLREPRPALLALPGLTYLAVLFFVAHFGQLRYLLPVVLVLALFAARAATVAWTGPVRALRWAVAGVAAFAIGLGLLRGLDLTYAMMNDSRYAAGRWLAENMPQGAQVDYFGASQTLPPLRSDVRSERAVPYQGAIHRHDVGPEVVEQIARRWRESKPGWIILMPDHSSARSVPHSATCPPEIYRGLLAGEYGYKLAVTFETPPLMPWVRRPALDYPTVNPPIRVFARDSSTHLPEPRP